MQWHTHSPPVAQYVSHECEQPPTCKTRHNLLTLLLERSAEQTAHADCASSCSSSCSVVSASSPCTPRSSFASLHSFGNESHELIIFADPQQVLLGGKCKPASVSGSTSAWAKRVGEWDRVAYGEDEWPMERTRTEARARGAASGRAGVRGEYTTSLAHCAGMEVTTSDTCGAVLLLSIAMCWSMRGTAASACSMERCVST